MTQVYALPQVAVILNFGISGGGGLFGKLETTSLDQFFSMTINNVYSKANVTCSGTNCCGPLAGYFSFVSNTNLTISSSYFANNILCEEFCSPAMVVTQPERVSYSQVFLRIPLSVTSFPPSNDASSPVALDCITLFKTVNNTFSPSIWGGDRLKIEYNYSNGVLSCPNVTNCSPVIYDCASLQAMIFCPNGSFTLNQSIDCTGFAFESVGDTGECFTGLLDGKGFSITNLTIVHGGGFFGNGRGAIVRNLVFFNVQVNLYLIGNSGAVFSTCTNCTISNVSVSTNDPSLTSLVKGDGNIGGIVGVLINSTITNCTVQNTLACSWLAGSSNAGGMIGYATNVLMEFCFNLGFPSNPSSIISSSCYNTGGLIGKCDGRSVISKSGVERGEKILQQNFFNFP